VLRAIIVSMYDSHASFQLIREVLASLQVLKYAKCPTPTCCVSRRMTHEFFFFWSGHIITCREMRSSETRYDAETNKRLIWYARQMQEDRDVLV